MRSNIEQFIAATMGLLVIALDVSALWSHQMWVEFTGDEAVIRYGHHINSTHSGQKQLAYRPEDVRSVSCLQAPETGSDARAVDTIIRKLPIRIRTWLGSKQGETPVEIPESQQGIESTQQTMRLVSVQVPQKCPALLVQFRSIHYTKTPRGTVRKSADGVRYPIDSWIAKETLLHTRNTVERMELTGAIERINRILILPPDGVHRSRPGQKWSFRVIGPDGPVEGVPVSINGDVRGVTDDRGRINLRIRSYGDQMIQASLSTPPPDSGGIRMVQTTTLHFQLKEENHETE